ncbi:uncharacterized protein LOC135362526 [Mirounga angustirostris]|uniref:uncharacterized protein LOC135362526 n=1 Tax=Mirounga angustirostris TaxID=9716 RepID=UPI00313D845E
MPTLLSLSMHFPGPCVEGEREVVEPPTTTSASSTEKKKRVRFSLHNQVFQIGDTEEDPVERQTDDLPRERTEEGAPPIPEVDAARNENSGPEGLLEGPSSKAEEETATLLQEEATGNGPTSRDGLMNNLSWESEEAEGPFFTKVVALLEPDSVATDLHVETIHDSSSEEEALSEQYSAPEASPPLSAHEEDSMDEEDSDGRATLCLPQDASLLQNCETK